MNAMRLIHVRGAGEPSVVLLESEKYLLVASTPDKLIGGLKLNIIGINDIVYNHKWESDWPMSICLMNRVKKLDWNKHEKKLAGIMKKFRKLTHGDHVKGADFSWQGIKRANHESVSC